MDSWHHRRWAALRASSGPWCSSRSARHRLLAPVHANRRVSPRHHRSPPPSRTPRPRLVRSPPHRTAARLTSTAARRRRPPATPSGPTSDTRRSSHIEATVQGHRHGNGALRYRRAQPRVVKRIGTRFLRSASMASVLRRVFKKATHRLVVQPTHRASRSGPGTRRALPGGRRRL